MDGQNAEDWQKIDAFRLKYEHPLESREKWVVTAE
jgi:hypothetical protein